jgi:DNA-binding LacI/PurR family transcriptional regulator
MKNEKPCTILDIARECGLSPSAVSKALNGSGNLRPETIERILRAAARLKYRPNTFAKNLRLSSYPASAGVIISDTSYAFFSPVMKGLEGRAEKEGYDLFYYNTDRIYSRERISVKSLASKKVSGLIFVASLLTDDSDLEYVKSFDLPFVYLIRYPENNQGIDFAANDNFNGEKTISEYLIKTGSRRLHFLSLSYATGTGKQRLNGYIDALKKHGIEYDEALVKQCPATFEGGYSAASEWLSRGEKIEVLVCGCDIIAIGALKAITQSGLRVPQDVRLVGYDDIEMSQYLSVPLTTMRQPHYDLGYAGMELLLNRISDPSLPPQHIMLQSDLIVREST